MMKIVGKDIWRGGQRVGWIDEHRIYARDGKKLGYFDDRRVYNEDGDKLAYVEGDYLYSYGGGSETKVTLETVSEEIEGGIAPGIEKCAVYVLLGD